jgi:hypothetical protein
MQYLTGCEKTLLLNIRFSLPQSLPTMNFNQQPPRSPSSPSDSVDGEYASLLQDEDSSAKEIGLSIGVLFLSSNAHSSSLGYFTIRFQARTSRSRCHNYHRVVYG